MFGSKRKYKDLPYKKLSKSPCTVYIMCKGGVIETVPFKYDKLMFDDVYRDAWSLAVEFASDARQYGASLYEESVHIPITSIERVVVYIDDGS